MSTFTFFSKRSYSVEGKTHEGPRRVRVDKCEHRTFIPGIPFSTPASAVSLVTLVYTFNVLGILSGLIYYHDQTTHSLRPSLALPDGLGVALTQRCESA